MSPIDLARDEIALCKLWQAHHAGCLHGAPSLQSEFLSCLLGKLSPLLEGMKSSLSFFQPTLISVRFVSFKMSFQTLHTARACSQQRRTPSCSHNLHRSRKLDQPRLSASTGFTSHSSTRPASCRCLNPACASDRAPPKKASCKAPTWNFI